MPKNFDEEEYVRGIIDDIKRMWEFSGKREAKSVFFGGGTPSLLSNNAVFRILDEIDKLFGIKKNAEITIEANPNTFEREKFLSFYEAGVNRLSLGVQALNEKDLKFLGRTHSLNDARQAMRQGVEIFDKFSVDLIYARPNQIFEEWVKEIDEVIDLGGKHISLYQLSIEEGTVFYRKKIKEMEEEESARFYEETVRYLRGKGFERYEVSNFAKGIENRSIHNLVYWNGGDYIGVGKGGAGRIKVDGKFYGLLDGKIDEILTSYERGVELLIMGFRVSEGIKFKDFFEITGLEMREFIDYKKAKSFEKDGLLNIDDEGIRLTDKGFLVMDKLLSELI